MYPDAVTGWSIPEEHLSEATFLWGRVGSARFSPEYTLERAADLEYRLQAHLDGLVVGGQPVAERLLKPALEEEDSFLVSASAAALLEQDAYVEPVLVLVLDGSELQQSAIRGVLEFSRREELTARLSALRGGLALEEPEALATALRVGPGALARVERSAVLRALGSPVPRLRDAALKLGSILGLRQAWVACQRLAVDAETTSPETMELLTIGGDDADVEALLKLASEPNLRASAIWALGFSGRVAIAEAALAWMRDEDGTVARLAGEAFSAITGLTLEGPYVRQAEPEAEEPVPFEDEDLDADLGPRPEQDLPLPEPTTVEEWWKTARRGFERNRRYLHGRLFDAQVLLEALAQAPMRRRHLLSLELAIRSRGQHWLETHAPIPHQYAWLARERSLPESLLRLPFKQLLTQG